MIRKRAINCYTYVLCALFVRTSFGGFLAAQPLPLPASKPENSAQWLGVWQVCFALLIVVGLILGIRWIFWRIGFGNICQKTSLSGSKGRSIQIIERKALGGRQSLLLVRCKNTEVLLHQSKARLSTLCVVDSQPPDEEGAQ